MQQTTSLYNVTNATVFYLANYLAYYANATPAAAAVSMWRGDSDDDGGGGGGLETNIRQRR